MFFFYTEGCYSDTRCGVAEHPDLAEALATFALVEPRDGPDLIAYAETATMHGRFTPEPLAHAISGYLLTTYGARAPHRKDLFDDLPIGVLRAAVEHQAAHYEEQAQRYNPKENLGTAKRLREALFLREQRDRIAADLADMERIAAMPL